jgi:hypothetical protein
LTRRGTWGALGGFFVLLTACVLFFARDGGREHRAPERDRVVTAPASSGVSAAPAEAAIADTTAPERDAVPTRDALADAASTEGRRRAATFDTSSRISGFVVVPGGFPADDDVQVVAEIPGDRIQERVAPVSGNGSFTVDLPPRATHALLDVRSRYLWLPAPKRVEPGDTDVRLDPVACAILEGEISPPDVPRWEETKVSWTIDVERFAERGTSDSRSSLLDEGADRPESGRFQSRVPAGFALVLRVEHPSGPDAVVHVDPLEPFETRAVSVRLEQGITITGRVVDELGQGVAGLRVVARDSDRPLRDQRGAGATTDAAGHFTLARVALECDRVVTANDHELVRGVQVSIDASAGDIHGLVLSIVRGGCIEGTVVWSDGEPVSLFSMNVKATDSVRLEDGSAGSFRVCGLTDTDHTLEFHATREGVSGSAELRDLRPGAEPVQVVLQEARAFELRGVVVDAEDRPLDEARVHARLRGTLARSRDVQTSESGSFTLFELDAGEGRSAPARPVIRR